MVVTAAAQLLSRCRRCPEQGAVVVAVFPGDAPGWKPVQRARQEADATGDRHHDHYDPDADQFVVVRHTDGGPDAR